MSRFRVIQFNMQFGMGWSDADPDGRPIALGATIAELRKHDADILLLQEVERALTGGRQIQPPPHFTALQEAFPGHDSFFAYPQADPRELPFGIGLAIFSRTALENRSRLVLPSPPVEFEFQGKLTTPTDRLLIGAATTIGGRPLRLMNTHLLAQFMLGAGGAGDSGQRDLVAEQLRTVQGDGLLAGDFNLPAHRVLLDQFAGCGFQTVQESEVTWKRLPYVLDHLFFNRSLRCVHHTVEKTPVSDHHLLVADFEQV